MQENDTDNSPGGPPRSAVRGLTKELASGRETLRVLDGVDLEIEAGESVAIVGPSGGGKSTLLGLLAGLDRPTRGSVEFDGQALESLNEDELAVLRRENIGFVFQSFLLLGNLTAHENVRVPMELTGVEGAGARTDELLERVALTNRAHHYPSQLSGGEQQRVALARAFGPRPKLLLADEPTGNLDSQTAEGVLALLVELREREGTTLVLVTHDPAVASRAERRIHLSAGRIVRDERDAGPALEIRA